MPITDAEKRINYLYHFTHVDNMLSIWEIGLLSHNEAHRIGCVRRDISDHRVQNLRSRKQVFDRPLHDYVPLYFTPRNAMLYVRRNIQSELVILCLDRHLLEQGDSIFTDGNAASDRTSAFQDIRDLDKLDWRCIRSRSRWTEFSDGKRKRCAEVLIPDHIPFRYTERVIVRTERMRSLLESRLRSPVIWESGAKRPEIEVQPRWYFDD